MVSLHYAGDLRYTQFKGTGLALTLDPIDDARWIDGTHALRLGFQRAF